jgi:hypothetical protein
LSTFFFAEGENKTANQARILENGFQSPFQGHLRFAIGA